MELTVPVNRITTTSTTTTTITTPTSITTTTTITTPTSINTPVNIPARNLSEKELIAKSSSKVSLLVKCKIVNKEGGVLSRNNNYKNILVDIWKTMDKQTIENGSKLNFKYTNEMGEKGYIWEKKINMSVQGADNSRKVAEILRIAKVNNFAIDLSIKLLETGEVVNFKKCFS